MRYFQIFLHKKISPEGLTAFSNRRICIKIKTKSNVPLLFHFFISGSWLKVWNPWYWLAGDAGVEPATTVLETVSRGLVYFG
jgi:hypothetical protein